jgi:hypothetical protein
MDDRHLGIQVRTWVPEDQFSIIRELAAGRQVSVSQIVRDLIATGLETDGQRQALDQALHRVTSALDHLERLLFFSVQANAFLLVSKEQDYRAIAGQKLAGPKEASELAAEWIGEIRGVAHERIRKALRGPNQLRKEVEDENIRVGAGQDDNGS